MPTGLSAIFIKKTEKRTTENRPPCPFISEDGFACHEYEGKNMFYIRTKQHSDKDNYGVFAEINDIAREEFGRLNFQLTSKIGTTFCKISRIPLTPDLD